MEKPPSKNPVDTRPPVGSSASERSANSMSSEPTEKKGGRSFDQEDSTSLQTIKIQEKISELADQVSGLQVELSEARRLPLSVLKDLLLHALLSFLSRSSPPIPERMANRFSRSASKRDPLRSLPEAMIAAKREIIKSPSWLSLTSEKGLGVAQDPTKKTIMVISHEASRTGAPILALNIAQEFSKKYNVVTVILGDGPLRKHFHACSTELYCISRRNLAHSMIREICNRYSISFALVNSVESRSVIPGLKVAGVPIVALLHEFASYTRPIGAFSDVMRDADQIVFSTRITLENALAQCGLVRGTSMHILPQGKCIVPVEEAIDEARTREQDRLSLILRPSGQLEREFVVIGAGTVEPRKAVDLFLECATRVVSSPGGGKFRFVWIGSGFDPEKDTSVSVYLADQIKRAGIQDYVSITGPTSEIEYAYRAADILLLSSRLDPLPNVAIDALVAGTPVLCFERTTGVADFLFEQQLGQACVARYLDTSDMANKILVLANDDKLRFDVAERGREAAIEAFNFAAYVGKLDVLATSCGMGQQQMQSDLEYLIENPRFRADFSKPRIESSFSELASVRHYLEGCRSGRGMRKPRPGFHPGIFSSRRDRIDTGTDPFVAYLQSGSPEGPWSLPVIDHESPVLHPNISNLDVAVHLHVTNPEFLSRLGASLEFNQVRPDIFVSTHSDFQTGVESELAKLPWQVRAFEVVPRRGGGIAALVAGFGKTLAKDYEYIGHCHAATDVQASSNPTDSLLENLFGGMIGGSMLDRILTAMVADPKLAVVYPDDPNIYDWAESRASADRLARRLGHDQLPSEINFPTGGMFLARSSALHRILSLNLTWEDFPPGRSYSHASLASAIPRLFGVIPGLEGMRTAVTNVRGVTW